MLPQHVPGLVQPHFVFCFLRHQSRHFVSSRPETRAVTTRVSGNKWVRYTVLMSTNKVLVMFGVSKRLLRSISLAVYCLFVFGCLAD